MNIQREDSETKGAVRREQLTDLEKFFLEGITGQIVGGAIVISSLALGVAVSGLSGGLAAPIGTGIMFGGTYAGAKIMGGATQKARERKKWEGRIFEGKEKLFDQFDKYFSEGIQGVLVGTGLAAAGAVALATGVLPLAGAVVAGGLIVVGARHAMLAPSRAKERQRWEKKLVE